MARIQTSGNGGNNPGSGTGAAQINSQTTSQNWELYSGTLMIYTYLILNNTFTIDGTATLIID